MLDSTIVRKLSVNIDHIATLREARRELFPDPVQAAVLAELGGADGITVHLRSDRRHIHERDVFLLKETIKTDLNIEMAATKEMAEIAVQIKPAMVTLVPEKPEEITTLGGLDLTKNLKKINPLAKKIKQARIMLSVFIEADKKQVESALKLRADQIEINTECLKHISDLPQAGSRILEEIVSVAQFASAEGLIVHAGHGLDYKNIIDILSIKEITGFSIGFAIIARAVFVGLKDAVAEMKRIIEHNL
ncbi:MAG: pyridoxine 5'-phosphate synthase [candidate division WOR-3 bacterium]|nr:pyridoxine 5'-phosphate synthase [candidate division WOR-3 bacterium]